MIHRRSDHDSLAGRSIARWLVICDMQGTGLEQEAFPEGTDLRAALTQVIARMSGECWVIEGDAGTGFLLQPIR